MFAIVDNKYKYFNDLSVYLIIQVQVNCQ